MSTKKLLIYERNESLSRWRFRADAIAQFMIPACGHYAEVIRLTIFLITHSDTLNHLPFLLYLLTFVTC